MLKACQPVISMEAAKSRRALLGALRITIPEAQSCLGKRVRGFIIKAKATRLSSDARKEIFVLKGWLSRVVLGSGSHRHLEFLAGVLDAFVRTGRGHRVRFRPG